MSQERFRRAFEGRDISPTEEAVEMLRREQWRASRAPFQRIGLSGAIGVGKGSRQRIILGQAGSSALERWKRLQFKFTLPKDGSWGTGYAGVVRIPDGLDFSSSDPPSWEDPSLLRPIQFHANPDQATYWELYLPAVNLAAGGQLQIHVVRNSDGGSSTYSSNWVFRAVVERDI